MIKQGKKFPSKSHCKKLKKIFYVTNCDKLANTNNEVFCICQFGPQLTIWNQLINRAILSTNVLNFSKQYVFFFIHSLLKHSLHPTLSSKTSEECSENKLFIYGGNEPIVKSVKLPPATFA